MEDDGDFHKTLVKLRRTPCDAPRPASTPPVIAASAVPDDEDDEEKIIAELQVPICVLHIAVISRLFHILSYVHQRRFSLQKVPVNTAAALGPGSEVNWSSCGLLFCSDDPPPASFNSNEPTLLQTEKYTKPAF